MFADYCDSESADQRLRDEQDIMQTLTIVEAAKLFCRKVAKGRQKEMQYKDT